jgi:hypothetical protein
MEGVEILNETVVYVTKYCWHIIWIMAVIIGVIVFLLKAWSYGVFCIDSDSIAALIMGTIYGALIGALLMIEFPVDTDEIDYITYQVTISDEVSMDEFNEKYEILDQEGKIYTVKEKE